MSNTDTGIRSARRNGWLVFATITLMVLSAGYGYFHSETGRIRMEKSADLSAIASLKSSQIEQWRKERLGDATRSATSPFFQQALEVWLGDRENPELRALWKKRLRREQIANEYDDVLLLDLDGRLLLSALDNPDPMDPATRQAMGAALAKGRAVFSDLYRCSEGHIHLDVAVPVSGAVGRPMAMFIMRTNAETYLYPLIQSWPTSSPSAETIIVRRDGDAVLFLNHLRHQSGSGLRLRIPLTETRIPAVQAVLGKKGLFQGIDYRGVAVLADLRSVPGFPWLMVTKVDTGEIMAEARYRTGITAFFVLVLILLAAMVSGFAYRQRQARFYRVLYRSEQRQRQAMEEFRTTLYSLGDGVITTDRQGRLRQMNPVAEQLTGWTEAEARNRPIEEIVSVIDEKTRDGIDNPAGKVLREGRATESAITVLLVSRDGRETPVIISGAPIQNENHSPTGAVLICHDQTIARKDQQKLQQSEADLAESEQKFRLIFENAPLGILHFDKNGVITACNDNFIRIIGSSKNALIGLDMLKLPDTRIVGILREALQGRTASFEGDYRSVTADKVTPTRVLFSPVVLESGSVEGGIGIVEDVTRQRQADAEREKLEAQFRQAQKMEAVGRLAGGIAHDFNNMLSIINGYAEMALMNLAPSDALYSKIRQIMNAGRRSADLVHQLLAFARKQTIAPICLNLNHTVAPMLSMLQSLIGEDIDLLWKPADDLWTVKMDPAQIDQILANLTVNARDAISGVGKVTIETGNIAFDASYCARHKGFIEGEFVMLAVSDDGCGMDRQTLDLLFEPFFTTKGVGKGTGLGLSTVYGIVKQNNGFINVYSEPGKGTTFKIYMPREVNPDTLTETTLNQPVEVPGGDETILVVEDEEMVLEIAKTILEQLGYTVLATTTPRDALDLAALYEGEIHLLMTDVVMPEMSGRDLCRGILPLRPGIRTLFMSGYTANVIAHHGVLDKGVYFLQKPFSMEALAVKLREVLSA